MGDLVENTCGFYPSQPFLTQLDRREQMRVVRRGVLDIIKAVAPLVPRITVTAVAGNHGENRQNGKRLTGFGDNDDVACFEQVAEICAENPDAFGHVGWRLPTDRMATSIDLSGHIVAFTHGHLAKPTGGPANALWGWWEKQAMGREYPGVADAGILCSGHYHHTNVRAQHNRVLFIAPSLTAVGDWWANATGMRTDPGTLTFCVDPTGWSALEIIR
jgi:predicted phosphodiesterase